MIALCAFLGACQTTRPTDGPGLADAAVAAAEQAQEKAGVDLPLLPGDCYVDTPHAPLIRGEELAVLLRRERGQLDAANHRRFECAKFYNDLRDRLKNKT